MPGPGAQIAASAAYPSLVTLLDELRTACARVAAGASHVRIDASALEAYAAALPSADLVPGLDPDAYPLALAPEQRAAYFLALDAINFGSGWFPTLRKRPGLSGYWTVALGLRDSGPWHAAELTRVSAGELAGVLGQDPGHELMALFARSLNELGARVEERFAGSFLAVAEAADGSAEALVEELATWPCYADVSEYEGRPVPFLKRAQMAASDLADAGVAAFDDLHRLTLFADNLVPHVLRLDGLLRLSPGLEARLGRGDLLTHGSPEEVELRAGAVHVAELLCAWRPDLDARDVDHLLWHRGAGERYKALERPRCRCTAY